MNDWGTTTKVPAEVVLAEGIVLAGDVHLYARPTYPPGPETVLEMLNRGDVFFALTGHAAQGSERSERMEALYLLIPLSVLAVLGAAWVFLWMSDSGQFDDMDGAAMRILIDEDPET